MIGDCHPREMITPWLTGTESGLSADSGLLLSSGGVIRILKTRATCPTPAASSARMVSRTFFDTLLAIPQFYGIFIT